MVQTGENRSVGGGESQCYVTITDPMWSRHGLNPGPRNERQATEHFSLA
jgi:hypothetical protein